MFFLVQSVVVVVGAIIHVFLDRKPDRRTARRVVELFMVWVIAGGGLMAIAAGLAHIGPNSDATAEDIGYTQSMFQWEIGWADIAIGVAGFLCIWKRDGWLTCAVTVLAISYSGDAIGHVMQYVAHDNTAPNNIWAIPSDIIQPLAAIALLVAYRRLSRSPRSTIASNGGTGSPSPAQPVAA
ncbi:MAG: hypothetical protein JJLCMIEE_02383 [Acidimicrobiales bacterium]|nr:MAG: hypothetical protein EDR02_15965 [Actinomycetota bacterium]MBV6509314.1 hypothetical protein [Acidimicrobiales bacterium]RIK03961.1 MAG: hypothetical protein DCC48_14745 [Acidobacteriota bacterium]